MTRSSVPTASTRTSLASTFAPKVPEITALFWVIKILTTGMGESASDFLGQVSVPLAGAIGVFGLAFALWLQLGQVEYRATIYWFAVLMVAVFGTMAADGVHDGLALPYSLTTLFYALVVGAIFFFWHRSEGTVDIHCIDTPRRERYYWGAVLATFALWAAYVVTRPLGASFADWFGKPHGQTGLGLGDGAVTGLALLAFIALVAYTANRRTDRRARPVLRPQPAEG